MDYHFIKIFISEIKNLKTTDHYLTSIGMVVTTR